MLIPVILVFLKLYQSTVTIRYIKFVCINTLRIFVNKKLFFRHAKVHTHTIFSDSHWIKAING